MTARLTNALGTRLGILHSWKTHTSPNIKTQSRAIFKREQQYNELGRSLFLEKYLKKQSVLYGNYVAHYNVNNQLVFDIFLYDTALQRTKKNIKYLRKYTALTPRSGGHYYQKRNMKLIRQNRKFSDHPIVQQVLRPKYRIWKTQNENKIEKQYNILIQTKNIVKKLKNRIILLNQDTASAYTKKQRRIRLIKIMLHYLIRARYFQYHVAKLKFRFLKKIGISLRKLKVNLITIPKIYVTTKIIMAFIIKKLYLNFTLFESIRHFKNYFKLRTSGYILRGCGKLTKKQRTWYVKEQHGITKINNLSELVTYAYSCANLRYGTVGIKLWLNF